MAASGAIWVKPTSGKNAGQKIVLTKEQLAKWASDVGQDPAAASGPLVTSLADILGIILYFSIASFVLT